MKMTKRHIQKKYEALLRDVATNGFYKTDLTNRVNCYVCISCKHITKTKDVDAGVTPFLLRCEKCKGTAQSTFYKDITPTQQPTFEWYRPTLSEVFRMSEGMRDHVLNGGLELRPIIHN